VTDGGNDRPQTSDRRPGTNHHKPARIVAGTNWGEAQGNRCRGARAARHALRKPPSRPRCKDFQRLDIWRKPHELTLAVIRAFEGNASRPFPGLRSQILRASATVPTNIAEGCGHRSTRELAPFADVSVASLSEVQYHLILARDLRLISASTQAPLDDRVVQIRRTLTAFATSIRRQAPRPPDSAQASASTSEV
jgi:four helix bundle protein